MTNSNTNTAPRFENETRTPLLRIKSTVGQYRISTVELRPGCGCHFETIAYCGAHSLDEVALVRTGNEAAARLAHRDVRMSLLGKLPQCRAHQCTNEVREGSESCADHPNYPELN